MNFVKRAAYSLVARKGKTSILLGIFVVVCSLLLGGFLLQGATTQQEAEAQRRIGVDVTVRGEGLTAQKAAKLGASPLVERYNTMLRGVPRAPGLKLVESTEPRPSDAKPEGNGPGLNGVRETEMLLEFAFGRVRVAAGRGITAADANREVVMIDKQAADKNGLTVGDRVTLASPDGRTRKSFEVVGVFEDPTAGPPPSVWMPPAEIPANQMYAPTGALRALGLGERPSEAVYKIRSPERAQALHALAERELGAGKDFSFNVNDKAYRDQVQPLQRVGAFANAVVWLIAVAGAGILGLIVTLTIRERRDELGMLLGLGEKKWKLIGQHTVEVAAVAAPALVLAAVAAGLFSDRIGDVLPDQEATDGTAMSASQTESLPRPEVRVTPGDLGKVAGTSLGIALVATVIPGIGIVRLHPRTILTDSD
ncbi:ABC transporter permease [Streptomyces sp. NPDC004726]